MLLKEAHGRFLLGPMYAEDLAASEKVLGTPEYKGNEEETLTTLLHPACMLACMLVCMLA